jgi:malonate transporter
MSIVTILFPDFAMILLGVLLVRYTKWGDHFWAGLEKLVYFVLFPTLLFYSTSRSPLDFVSAGKMLQVALAALLCTIALSWLAKRLFKGGPMVFESGMQTAFRFNSYIALALAYRLGGDQATSLMALIMGFSIPICNMAAVHALVRGSGGGGLFKELARNPLLIATASGVLFNAAGLQLPEVVAITLARVGNASIALGLLLVGAGLRLTGLHEAKAMAAYFLVLKHVAYPAIGLLLGQWAGLTGLQLQIVVVFCALPTAASAYVLATRMGGNGPFVAFLVSASTLLSALSLPFWLLATQ